MTRKIFEIMKTAALAAGEEIRRIYLEPIVAEQKTDGSPVTIADQNAEIIILDFLKQTGLPVLAEESVAAGNIPELGDRYFIVDPLDGTKEFIKRNGEFTVNIALIENGRPIAGVVTVPAQNVGFIGSKLGAYQFTISDGVAGEHLPISVARKGPIDIVASRSHGSGMLDVLAKKMSFANNVSVGSSLKFCLLAMGKARLYPRFTPTCEWDIAAGQAVLEAAGGFLLTKSCSPMSYGKANSNFINPFFVASDDEELARKTAALMAEIC